MKIEELKRYIKDALINAIDDLNIAYNSLNSFKFPEYYLTANIASTFIDYAKKQKDEVIIHVEEKTSEFSRYCCPILGIKKDSEDSFFNEPIFSKPKDVVRKGKFDICLYKKNDEDKQSFCCIEVKGNRPSNNSLRKDLLRMTELFSKKDETGDNLLEYALLPFVYDVTSNWYTEKRIENIINEKNLIASPMSNSVVNWEFTILDTIKVDTSTDVIEEDYLDCHGKYLVCCFIGTKKKEPQKC